MLRRNANTFRTILIVFLLAETLPLAAQEDRLKDLDARAQELYKKGKYADALPAAQEALKLAEAGSGAETPREAIALNRLGEIYDKLGDYANAEPRLQRALAIREKILGPEHPDVAESLNSLGDLYGQLGKYADCESLFKRALAIREKALGADHPDVASSLNNLGEVYKEQGRRSEAEPLFKRALTIREKALGPDHPDVATSLNSLGELYKEQGQPTEAETLYKRALAIREKVLGPEHPDVAETLNDLAVLYDEQGRYAESEQLYKRALPIFENAIGPTNASVAIVLSDLAALYSEQGRYSEAEPLFKRALSIDEKALGADHPDVAIRLSNLALAEAQQGRYSEAELLYRRALNIDEKARGPDHPKVAIRLDSLAWVYQNQRRYEEAEPLFKQALAIFEKALGPDHINVGFVLNSLGALYNEQGRYEEAEPLFKQALAIFEKALGPDHRTVATTLNNLAYSAYSQGRYGEAEDLLKRALAMWEKSLGPDYPLVAHGLERLAEVYGAQGRYAEAEPLYKRALESLMRRFEYAFTYMSEKDRMLLLDTVEDFFPDYLSFCLKYHNQDPGLAGEMFDVALAKKGLVAGSMTVLRTQIAAGEDKVNLALLEQLGEKKTQLAGMVAKGRTNRAEWQKTITELEKQTNELEEDLVRRSSSFAAKKRLSRTRWEDVEKALEKGEAAVEIVRFPFRNGRERTSKIYYVGLILTRDMSSGPLIVVLGDAEKIEGPALLDYRNWITPSRAAHGNMLYQSYWAALEKTLAGYKRIFLSPDGVLNEISLGVIPTLNGRFLMDKYDLRIVSSTRDLLREKPISLANTAILIGDPKFDLTETQQHLATVHFHNTGEIQVGFALADRGLRSRDKQAKRLSPLPGTRVELERIRSELAGHGWKVEVFKDENALVEAVKETKGPRVLHLATHGFFLPDQERQKESSFSDLQSTFEDPMLRSGLYFAGADRALSGASSSSDLGDGVLTAYEASGLNLQGTELVVLSACETGLGQVRNGEGVFGLRRAFQEAGAQAVLMSLWSVPDRETQELMGRFYRHWLSGQDKAAALRNAQLELRRIVKTRYGQDRPFYWGGFILVGN